MITEERHVGIIYSVNCKASYRALPDCLQCTWAQSSNNREFIWSAETFFWFRWPPGRDRAVSTVLASDLCILYSYFFCLGEEICVMWWRQMDCVLVVLEPELFFFNSSAGCGTASGKSNFNSLMSPLDSSSSNWTSTRSCASRFHFLPPSLEWAKDNAFGSLMIHERHHNRG